MNIQLILEKAIAAIKQKLPEAIYNGFLVSQITAFDPETNTNTVSSTLNTPVEIIFDTLTQEEIQASTILETDLKMYVVGDKINDINFYQLIKANGKMYKILRKTDQVIGSKTALWTIIARQQRIVN